MIVECIRVTDGLNREVASSPWISLGARYSVLSVSIGLDDGDVLLQIYSDNEKTPIFVHAANYEILDARMPPTWRISMENRHIYLSPEPWLAPGFLEEFFNGEHEAVQIFWEERQKILDWEKENPYTEK